MTVRIAVAAACLAGLAAAPVTATAASRWYSGEQATGGRALFAEHCAACHGAAGEGQPGWEERDASGYYPPPPLDATGHAARHSLESLLAVLEMGTAPRGGTMPSFADVLDANQRRAVMAFVQSLWPDPVYAAWVDIDRGTAAPPAGEHHDH